MTLAVSIDIGFLHRKGCFVAQQKEVFRELPFHDRLAGGHTVALVVKETGAHGLLVRLDVASELKREFEFSLRSFRNFRV